MGMKAPTNLLGKQWIFISIGGLLFLLPWILSLIPLQVDLKNLKGKSKLIITVDVAVAGALDDCCYT